MESSAKPFEYSCDINPVPEKQIKKIWEDVVAKNIESLNKSLMKEIEKNREREASFVKGSETPVCTKQMWDSEKGEWIPFSLWGAHFIVNERKESLSLRIYRPCTIQPEFGPAIKGWHSLDSSYLNEKLKEKDSAEKYDKEISIAQELSRQTVDLFKSFSGYQSFLTMVRQDKEEYENPF